MKIYETDTGYNIETVDNTLIVESQSLGGKAYTMYQGEKLMVQVKPTLLYFFSPRFNIKRDGKIFGQITQKYFGGNFEVQFDEAGQEQNYLLKTYREKKYELVDSSKNTVLSIHSDFSLRKLSHSYEALTSTSFQDLSYCTELAFFTMFCIVFDQTRDKSAI